MRRAFICAFKGILGAARRERNFRIMLGCFAVVLAAGLFWRLSGIEWSVVLICCGGVLAFELMNTALEAAVDLVTRERCELAKKAKDAAAGASFVFSMFSVAVGLIIFVPRILKLLGQQ